MPQSQIPPKDQTTPLLEMVPPSIINKRTLPLLQVEVDMFALHLPLQIKAAMFPVHGSPQLEADMCALHQPLQVDANMFILHMPLQVENMIIRVMIWCIYMLFMIMLVVARGKVPEGRVIHRHIIPEDHVRVEVSTLIKGDVKLPVPNGEYLMYVAHAHGLFASWPHRLIGAGAGAVDDGDHDD